MEVSVKWFDGQYPSFNLMLASGPGKEPFLEIKGCKLMDGKNGTFVSYPSRKQENGKYWNHVYASEQFNAVVLEKAQASKPQGGGQRRRQPEQDDSSIPF